MESRETRFIGETPESELGVTLGVRLLHDKRFLLVVKNLHALKFSFLLLKASAGVCLGD
jgi:hypothetical protein